MAESDPLLDGKMEIPLPMFTAAIPSARGRNPQAIAHRGYKAAYPENTMGAFKGAVDVGAHAIETDIHLSKDGVVVLSHDATLKRCFGEDKKIVDCDWSYLKTLRTLQKPHEPMPRLKDLLEYLAEPGLEDVWVLLDIKVPWPSLAEPLKNDRINRWAKLDNHAEDVFRLMAATLADTKPSRPWKQRILLGCWAAKHLPLCTKYLPGYSITHIGFSITYARQFLKVPGAGFNMLQKIMVGPFGNAFLRDVKTAKRSIFVWTVNEEDWMKWSIRKEVDGVITDDPKKFLEVCDTYQGEEIHLSFAAWPALVWMNALAVLFSVLFRYRYGFKIPAVPPAKTILGR
ncbi:putative Glycerophosphoryl diester phosphodiesterase [Venustampulla echinocandica]|uniref:Putative Glycerophosphoryl diester phosphodiesterase n=1 Tax=Venustampulla echinocandica TaxID=2656787 RepID=A0A370TUL5_9HELO|nr:putative Glycerophosphoryl diester phosphodiesterase [Venustampulla echinocandica]RDL39214.1 putative Glycerophosphoryl diester phosphodiesterase [Venustampulla echinocandica]